MMHRVTIAAALLLHLGCSSASDVGALPPEEGSDTGGRAGLGGGASVAGNAGVAAANAAGGNGAAGGIGGAGGTAGAAGSAAISDTAGCPVWPPSKLMPLVGPFFYGTHPGPCSYTVTTASGSITTTTFGYSGESLATATSTDGMNETFGWSGGLMVLDTQTASASGQPVDHHFTYSADALVETFATTAGTNERRYSLSSTGYPTSVIITNAGSTQPMYANYEYVNCRLTQRETFVNGAVVPTSTVTYEYDAAGQIVTKTYGDGEVDRFEYGCW